jgi:ATP synthase protein I
MSSPSDSEPPEDGRKVPASGDLAARIARARAIRPAQAAAEQVRAGEASGMGRAFRLASEFTAAIIVGGALGFGADKIFGSAPWGMITLLLLGFVAGVLNVVRSTRELNAATAAPPNTPAVDDDDD